MPEFQVFVTDDRYTVPSLYIIEAASAERACELAQGIFAKSLHHTGVQLFDDDACILTLGAGSAAGQPPAASPPPPTRPRRPRP